ncbi:MAG: allophanate hydrolase [Bacillaceae bacterium]|uniref:5-oxoprolinase subunit PxpB n=1 Tax=Aeribacillus TaxID=1055323 RepID=UPI000E34575D|nr:MULTISPECIES: 5-oxoprolinase subunit PxpB [Aeribacillus]REJ19852.1 MAG: allophanate hydrolase [Bacillaceae bacterium]MDR9796993.1 5-oxoprolinase subunit PxpB [Aeribacillus pallidus]MED0716828.1 5-oxoprolinase subunit PxpB [Aeribacillus composti]MED0746023.1 5-oxoprolinase subunit PxpB [Aeribacillus composti]MED1441276.1 5-oxoprolinase subunit PxpB [Aeribacillus composti]
MEFSIQPLGDTGIIIQFGTEISEAIYQQIRQYVYWLEQSCIEGIVEWVPAYTTLAVFYRPNIISYDELSQKLLKIGEKIESMPVPDPIVIEIPTLYGKEAGPDIQFVAETNGLSEEEVVKIHSSSDYLIYMIGFVPGFPYLGGMDKRIAAPRKKTPRSRIPAGSIGIAGEQTGIYPLETPGGWQIIGRTPVKLYDPQKQDPILLKAGDYIRFVPITEREYEKIEQQVLKGSYKVVKYKKEAAET